MCHNYAMTLQRALKRCPAVVHSNHPNPAFHLDCPTFGTMAAIRKADDMAASSNIWVVQVMRWMVARAVRLSHLLYSSRRAQCVAYFIRLSVVLDCDSASTVCIKLSTLIFVYFALPATITTQQSSTKLSWVASCKLN